jgi:hypothetical protein
LETVESDRSTIPTSDAEITQRPGVVGSAVLDFETYRKWILGETTARDVVEKVVGYE